jgi:hypothetical protein
VSALIDRQTALLATVHYLATAQAEPTLSWRMAVTVLMAGPASAAS